MHSQVAIVEAGPAGMFPAHVLQSDVDAAIREHRRQARL
jgi:ribulose 1,5-bisphosphate synthetase/thiazole synthase